MDWASYKPAVSLPDIYLFAYLREDGPPVTDTQWLRTLSFMYISSISFADKEVHCCLFVEALCGMARMDAP